MSKTDEAAQLAAKHSRIWTIAALASGGAALAMGFASFFGAFSGFVALAAALMAVLALLALFCGAQAASLRSSARVMGWMPAKELNAEAIQAKNDYLNAVLKEMGAPLTEEAAKRASSSNEQKNEPKAAESESKPALDPVEEEAIDSLDTQKEKDRATQVFQAVRQTEQELVEAADEIVSMIDEAASIPADELHEQGLTDEELIVAAAEALLAQAAAQPESTQNSQDDSKNDSENKTEKSTEEPQDSDDFPSEAESMAFELPEYANMTMLEEEDEESFNVIPASAKSRQIAKKRIATVDRMLSRAEDIFATSRDLARAQVKDKAFANLHVMLKDNPALDDKEMPKTKPIKLSRNNRQWMGGNGGNVPNKVFDALLSLEASFNINQDILRLLGEKPELESQSDTRSLILSILTEAGRIEPNYASKVDYLSTAYPDVESDEVVGEWALRCKIANAVENAALPFRLTFDMMTNAAEGMVLISLEIPRPECFCFVSTDEEGRQALARDYAVRSALFMAKVALGAGAKSSPIQRAIVCCHPHNEARTLLSMDATEQTLPKLTALAEFLAPMPVPIGYPAIRMLCETDWMDSVTPHILPTDDIWRPKRYTTLPETSQSSCYPRLADASGAKLECDLGTREEAPMEQAWIELKNLGDSAESAVSAIKALRESSNSDSVKAGCDRVMRALVDGTAEPSQMELLATIFMGDNELSNAIAFGMRAFTTKSEEDLIETVDKLKELLTPELQISMMDDTETVFRYFHNVAERIHYNLTSDDDRKIALVPRGYYSANELAVYLLCQMERPIEAEPFAREILRIAPLSSNSAVTMARVMERQDRIMEAIDLVNQAIKNASTVHDAALCYYRMAYLQWRAGREDLANAAYRLTVALRSEVSRQAQQELKELLDSNKELVSLTPAAACRKLDEAGIIIWDLEGFKSRMAQNAVLCADQTLFSVAAQLTLGLLEFQNDDALTDVYKSFTI